MKKKTCQTIETTEVRKMSVVKELKLKGKISALKEELNELRKKELSKKLKKLREQYVGRSYVNNKDLQINTFNICSIGNDGFVNAILVTKYISTDYISIKIENDLSIFYEAFEHPTSSDLICGAKEVPFEKFKKELDDAFFWLKNQTFEK